MDAVALLTTRCSDTKLTTPAPSLNDMDIIQKSAVRVPDHAGLAPWQFIVFDSEEALSELGNMYAKAAMLADPDCPQETLERATQLPFRAPLVIACIAKYVEHQKVPRVEQVISAGCATMAMQQAAFALGYGGIWRTGSYAHNPHMKTLLGLAEEDEIVGYLYLGTPQAKRFPRPEKDPANHFKKYEVYQDE